MNIFLPKNWPYSQKYMVSISHVTFHMEWINGCQEPDWQKKKIPAGRSSIFALSLTNADSYFLFGKEYTILLKAAVFLQIMWTCYFVWTMSIRALLLFSHWPHSCINWTNFSVSAESVSSLNGLNEFNCPLQ